MRDADSGGDYKSVGARWSHSESDMYLQKLETSGSDHSRIRMTGQEPTEKEVTWIRVKERRVEFGRKYNIKFVISFLPWHLVQFDVYIIEAITESIISKQSKGID